LYLFEKAVEYRCSCIRCSSAATRAAVALAGPEFTASHCIFGRGGVNLKFMDPTRSSSSSHQGGYWGGEAFLLLVCALRAVISPKRRKANLQLQRDGIMD